jgi:hypothetical protein
MKLVNALMVVAGLVAGNAALAKTHNCEVKGKKVSVKDEAACAKKKGTWLAPAADAAASAPAGAHDMAPAAGTTAPADHTAPAPH